MFYYLTNCQKQIYRLEKMYANTPINIIGGYKIIYGNINMDILEESINLFIQNNDGIRIVITEKNNKVYQKISKFSRKKLDFYDFSLLENPDDALKIWVKKIMETPLDITQASYYFALIKISETEKGYLVKLNHIVADGWSLSLLENNIRIYYEQLLMDNFGDFTTEPSYVELIKAEEEYSTSKIFQKNKKYWTEKFGAITKKDVDKNTMDIKGKRNIYRIKGQQLKKIYDLIKDYSISDLFILVYAIYLKEVMGRKAFILGIPVFNRGGKRQKKIFGMYTNNMLFQYTLNVQRNVHENMVDIKKELFRNYMNQKYPYNLLIEDIQLRNKSIQSLYNVCLNIYNSELSREFSGYKAKNVECYCGCQSYSLQIVVNELKDLNELQLYFDYKTELYHQDTIEKMYQGLLTIIERLWQNQEKKICEIDFGISSEQKLIREFNPVKSEYPKDKNIVTLFEQQVIKTPDNLAVSDSIRSYTYEQLNQKANQLARFLMYKGVQREEVVGIMNENSCETLVCILGILKAGGIYLPIDTNYPEKRVDSMLTQADVRHLLTNIEIEDKVAFAGNIIHCDVLYTDEVERFSNENIGLERKGDSVVYVIFTSGSSGRPKGVMVENNGLVNYIHWAKMCYDVTEEDRFPLFSSIAFDLTVTSIFLPLLSGSGIFVYAGGEAVAPILRIIKENRCTIVKLTPAHLRIISDMDFSQSIISRFIVGGEELKTEISRRIHQVFDGNIQIYNEYGPTETVVGCMIHKYHPQKDESLTVPIGVPIANTRIYILNEELQPVQYGEVGEIYIAGDCVARGYLGNQELTAKKFLADPFWMGERMYRSGDLGRHLSCGVIEYVGRKDFQVKIRGYRVELGEISGKINLLEEIKESVVTVEQFSGNDQLCAFIVKNSPITEEKIKMHLSKYLPGYMIPVEFIELSEIPININGKVDRKRLTKIKEEWIFSDNVSVNKNESELLRVLETVLNVKNIAEDNNFYHLGGDSIKAIQVTSKFADMGYEISVNEILSEPVIKNILNNVHRIEEKDSVEWERGNAGKYPIINWFQEEKYKKPGKYMQTVVLDLLVDYSKKELENVMNGLIRQHGGLRLNLSDELFYNDNHRDGIEIPVYTIENGINEEKFIEEIIAGIDFDITKDLLFKVILFKGEARTKKLLLAVHHLVIDGVSWRILLEDLQQCMKQYKEQKEIDLGRKTDSISTWIIHLNEFQKEILSGEGEYWMKMVKGINNNRTDNEFFRDTYEYGKTIYEMLEEEMTALLLTTANEMYNTKIQELLVCALAITIAEMNDSEDVIINLEGHGRNEIWKGMNLSKTIGWFTNMYPLRLLMNSKQMDERIKYVKEQMRTVPNGGIGAGLLQYREDGPIYDISRQINFNYLGDFSTHMKNEYFEISSKGIRLNKSKENKMSYLIDVNCFIVSNRLQISVEYSSNIYKRETMTDFLQTLVQHVEFVVAHCMRIKKRQFTPSDFDVLNISFEDLKVLFD